MFIILLKEEGNNISLTQMMWAMLLTHCGHGHSFCEVRVINGGGYRLSLSSVCMCVWAGPEASHVITMKLNFNPQLWIWTL